MRSWDGPASLWPVKSQVYQENLCEFDPQGLSGTAPKLHGHWAG